jgi:GNAT superfamily N-acetyltransferase
MPIDIRAVTAGDHDKWSDLWRSYLQFYKTELPPEVYAASWQRILDPDTPMHSALAFRGDEAIGLVNFLYHKSFWDTRDRCYLNDLYVSTDARGAGAGESLIRYVDTHAAGCGAGEVYWLTAQDNLTARRLYDRVATLTPFIKYKIA